MVIVNAVVHPVDKSVISRGFVAWEGGRITAVGPMEALPDGDLGETLDARGGHATPGYMDAHCHLGLFPDGQSYGDACFNASQPIAPEFDPLTHADLTDRCLAEALAAGVTTAVIAPGSANPVGGRIACIKTNGDALRTQPNLKLALGETPERTTGLAAGELARLLEETLASLPDEEGRSVHLHAHRAADIAAALELKERLGLRLVLVHGTEGYLMADRIAQSGASVITGPAMTDRSKAELKNACLENPAILARAGVKVAICTDHPETPAQYLPLCAGLAVRGGMEEEAALAAITLAPAEIMGLDKRLGSLTPGKDADIVVTPGHPFDPRVVPETVILNGRRVV